MKPDQPHSMCHVCLTGKKSIIFLKGELGGDSHWRRGQPLCWGCQDNWVKYWNYTIVHKIRSNQGAWRVFGDRESFTWRSPRHQKDQGVHNIACTDINNCIISLALKTPHVPPRTSSSKDIPESTWFARCVGHPVAEGRCYNCYMQWCVMIMVLWHTL